MVSHDLSYLHPDGETNELDRFIVDVVSETFLGDGVELFQCACFLEILDVLVLDDDQVVRVIVILVIIVADEVLKLMHVDDVLQDEFDV